MPIHPTAIVSENAIIGEGTNIGPFVIIEDEVKIGKNNTLLAKAFIGNGTTIGDNNEIHMGAVVGHVPQDKKFESTNKSYVVVGDNNIIREYATIHRGCSPESTTTIGSNCLIMGGCHIAHDCIVGDYVIMANMSAMAGHVEVQDRAFISGGAMIHQFVKVGRLAILAGNSRFSMDIPPFVIAAERNQVLGINVIGLKRAGFSNDQVKSVKDVYRIIYKDMVPLSKALKKADDMESKTDEITEFIDFIKSSKRGVCRSHYEGGRTTT